MKVQSITSIPREWVGEVRLSNGRYWRTAKVRVRAGAAPTAARRALLLAKCKIGQGLHRPFRIAGVWMQIAPIPRPRKGVRREAAV
jgi:hypothetical protein